MHIRVTSLQKKKDVLNQTEENLTAAEILLYAQLHNFQFF